MTIKKQGGVFGRNPSFNDIEANTGEFGSVSAGTGQFDTSLNVDGRVTSDGITVNGLYGDIYDLQGYQLKIDARSYGANPILDLDHDFFGSGYVRLMAQRSSGNFEIYTGGQLRQEIRSTDGRMYMFTGNLAFANGLGIDFSADGQAAGMTSELLDDYEEGTWTPVLYGTTTAGTQAYTWQRGTYTKIGNRVIADFTILIGTKDATTAGQLEISGLPFTVNVNAGIPQAAFAFRSNMILQTNAYYHTAQPKINTAVIAIGQAGSTAINTGDTAFANGTQLIGSVQYYV